jgi:hypothetical protein
VSRRDQRLDEGDDVVDRLGREWFVVGAAEAEPIGVLEIGRRHLPGEARRGHARLASGLIDLVVDVGDVDDEPRLVTDAGQEPPQQHEDDERTRVADVDSRVDRRPARIHPHRRGLPRLEQPGLAAQRVPDPDLAHVR